MPTLTVRMTGNETRTVKAYPITGTSLAVTQAVKYSGYVVTHSASGMRMPGLPFRIITDAKEAVHRLIEVMPDALTVIDSLAARKASTADKARLRDAWLAIVSPPSEGEFLANILPNGWDGDADTLTCPHGHTIEHDGRCPNGCVSPLRAMGLI